MLQQKGFKLVKKQQLKQQKNWFYQPVSVERIYFLHKIVFTAAHTQSSHLWLWNDLLIYKTMGKLDLHYLFCFVLTSNSWVVA